MAPIENTLALSHVEGVSDSARARELYKYYQPIAPINQDTCFPPVDSDSSPEDSIDGGAREINIQSAVTSSKVSSPDTALTAFCQLVSWRTGAQRAMISLIDADTQYFIAEATKTVDLIDNTNHAPGDGIWIGCSSVSKAGRLCERTIAQSATVLGDYPAFIVNDLSADDRFNELPFVTESPFLRFYAGVPLVTKRGIPIGSLFVVDDRVWKNGLSRESIHFMGTMAVTIMKHLEMVREVEEHRRGMKMSRGLASFVEGRIELAEAEMEAEMETGGGSEGTKVVGQFENDLNVTRTKSQNIKRASPKSRGGSVTSLEQKENEYSAALSKTEIALQGATNAPKLTPKHPDLEDLSPPPSYDEISVSHPSTRAENAAPTPQSPSVNISEASAMQTLFSRAANLIREAFEVDGGAVFYDAQRGFVSMLRRDSAAVGSRFGEDSQPEYQTSGDDQTSAGEQDSPLAKPDNTHADPSLSPLTTAPGFGDSTFSHSSVEESTPLEVLGFSTPEASSINGDRLPGPQSFRTLGSTALNNLLKRYPRGKLWTFDSDGSISSSSDGETFNRVVDDSAQKNKDLKRKKVRNAKNKSDGKYLLGYFPGVRQLLFVPLWDAGRSCWLSGCFVWSTEPTRVLSKQGELAFLSAFGNSVMAECSRIDTELADQKKGDFIGSISHELRSPLHGILASAEFLGEEDLTGFERGLVETIDSCGRTLLDTINHVLDFSKINQFERVWRKKRGTRHGPQQGDGGLSLKKSDLPMVNLFAEVDVSVICEEVVEGVFAGHVFQNQTAGSFDVVPAPRIKMSDQKMILNPSDPMIGKVQLASSQVQVVFDVDMQAYNFVTQPGAFRRIIMNLLGNALKYTFHGYVFMKLHTTPMEPLHTPATLEIVARSLITLHIKDTGRGISSEFLRSKVFTPFAQENSLSSGTGLGLSIVRNIVALLEGDIRIDSEVGRGTDVRVNLPLLHHMPKTADSGSSNAKSQTSGPREVDDAVSILRSQVVGRKVALHGFDVENVDPVIQEMYALLKASVTNFLTNWYGLQVVPLGARANIIISNEGNPATISKLARQAASSHRNNSPTIVVLCNQSARFDRNISPSDTKYKIGYVAKPVGPLKLAKAIIQSLEGALPLPTPGQLDGPYASPSLASNDFTNAFEELSVSADGGGLLDNSRMAADSDNARKAIESPNPSVLADKTAEFPFPVPDDRPKPQSLPGSKENLLPVTRTSKADPASLTLTAMENSAKSTQVPVNERLHAPSMLLVDDNNINLKLLSTYMHKKNYPIVDEAVNGLEAVNKFSSHPGGYDIIFMDISMPILDGFGATKQIRAMEASRRQEEFAAATSKLPNLTLQDSEGSPSDASDLKPESKPPSLVIALTGLASGRDQQEAASVGIDIFLTKPVSFKEVGRLLENWEANQQRDIRSSPSSGTST